MNRCKATALKLLYNARELKHLPKSSFSQPPPNNMSRIRLFACIAIALISLTHAANYCGSSWWNASKCQTGCPRGVDSECPGSERCYAHVRCASHTRFRHSSPVQRSTPRRTRRGQSSSSRSGSAVSRGQFNQMFPSRNSLYSYHGFVSAAASFPGFMTTGSMSTRKREAAAFFANIAHESCNLQCTRELNTANHNSYCDSRTALRNGFTSSCSKNGRHYQYYGRGPMQLSWNYNYESAGAALRTDLLHSPDLVATDSRIAWGTAIWFWMRSRGAGSSTPHDAITSGRGFGETIRAINGALECGGRARSKVESRISKYRQFVGILGTSVGGGSLAC